MNIVSVYNWQIHCVVSPCSVLATSPCHKSLMLDYPAGLQWIWTMPTYPSVPIPLTILTIPKFSS